MSYTSHPMLYYQKVWFHEAAVKTLATIVFHYLALRKAYEVKTFEVFSNFKTTFRVVFNTPKLCFISFGFLKVFLSIS